VQEQQRLLEGSIHVQRRDKVLAFACLFQHPKTSDQLCCAVLNL
jgi:hypothetical protein